MGDQCGWGLLSVNHAPVKLSLPQENVFDKPCLSLFRPNVGPDQMNAR